MVICSRCPRALPTVVWQAACALLVVNIGGLCCPIRHSQGTGHRKVAKLGQSQADHCELMHALILHLLHLFAFARAIDSLYQVYQGCVGSCNASARWALVWFETMHRSCLQKKKSISVLSELLRTCRRNSMCSMRPPHDARGVETWQLCGWLPCQAHTEDLNNDQSLRSWPKSRGRSYQGLTR